MYYRIGFPDEIVLATKAEYDNGDKVATITVVDKDDDRYMIYMEEWEWEMFAAELVLKGCALLECDERNQELANNQHLDQWWYRFLKVKGE